MSDEAQPTVHSVNFDVLHKTVSFQVGLPDGGHIHGNIPNVDAKNVARAIKRALTETAKAF